MTTKTDTVVDCPACHATGIAWKGAEGQVCGLCDGEGRLAKTKLSETLAQMVRQVQNLPKTPLDSSPLAVSEFENLFPGGQPKNWSEPAKKPESQPDGETVKCQACFAEGVLWEGTKARACPACNGYGRATPEYLAEQAALMAKSVDTLKGAGLDEANLAVSEFEELFPGGQPKNWSDSAAEPESQPKAETLDCPACHAEGVVWQGAKAQACPACDGQGKGTAQYLAEQTALMARSVDALGGRDLDLTPLVVSEFEELFPGGDPKGWSDPSAKPESLPEDKAVDCPVCFADGVLWEGVSSQPCSVCNGKGRAMPEYLAEQISQMVQQVQNLPKVRLDSAPLTVAEYEAAMMQRANPHTPPSTPTVERSLDLRNIEQYLDVEDDLKQRYGPELYRLYRLGKIDREEAEEILTRRPSAD